MGRTIATLDNAGVTIDGVTFTLRECVDALWMVGMLDPAKYHARGAALIHKAALVVPNKETPT
jgi:hypothetical protein